MTNRMMTIIALAATLATGAKAENLFNGRDLDGWYTYLKGRGKNVDPKEVFTVTNGIIRVSGEEFGALVTEREYSDYHLSLEYRFTGGPHFGGKVGWAPDSGILFHSTGPDGGFHGVWMESIEVNLIKGATGDFWGVGMPDSRRISLSVKVGDEKLGGKYNIYSENGTSVYTIAGNTRVCRSDIARDWQDTNTMAVAGNERPIGEWNKVDLHCCGGDVCVYFNGKLVNRGFDAKPRRGRIQLQSEGCPIEFRNIKLVPEHSRALEGSALRVSPSRTPATSSSCGGNPFRAADYRTMREELRAFYPQYGQFSGPVKDPRQAESFSRIEKELKAWCAAHSGYDALDVRRESYLAMRRHFVPFLFKESPFYFEAGINGGWSGKCPARIVNDLCRRFYKEQNLVPDEAFARLSVRMSERFLVCCGPFSDDMHHVPPFHTVFTKGFSGVRREVEAALAACPADDPLGKKELETALVGLDTIHELQLAFAKEANEKVKVTGEGEERRNLLRIAESAKRCPWEPPRTFYEGLNTLWFVREILSYVDGLDQFALGHPDAWLIDAYRREIAAGTLTVEEARDLVARFLIVADCHLDTMAEISDTHQRDEAEIPLTLGGCDATGRRVYNELTEMFLDVHFGCDCVYPKLHCRIAADDPKAYLQKIGSMLLEGHAVFALFNDDRHVPQFVKMGYPLERARDYICTGCWDGHVDSWTDVDGGNYVSVGRILELTLYPDADLARKVSVRTDPIDGLDTFEKVRNTVYRNFIRFFRDVTGDYTLYGRANAKVFPHPTYSMCLKGGLETRRDTTDGGIAFRPRVMTIAFLANVVDSLCAIRKVCFEDRAYSLGELLAAMRSNWRGEKGAVIRKAVLDAPYWGDNSPASNGMMRWWIDSVADDIDGLRSDQDRPYVLATWIYREFKHWGEKTRATPDGRFDGDRLAQGFAPSEYRCKEGVTTVFNAIGSLDHTRLFASNANLAFEKTSMTPELFEAVFRVACRKDMHLLQPNCLSVEELLDAQAHPERHQDLIIKVCGFSARFVALSKKWQDEVINRHRLK